MRYIRFFHLLLVAVFTCSALCAQDWNHQSYPASGARSALISDLNGDGFPDIVTVLGGASSGFSVMLNRGGVFSAPEVLSTTAVQSLLAADFNNDGKADLARCNQQGVSIFLGDGALHFNKVSTTPASCSLRVGDFNHDGRLDLVSIDRVTNSQGQFLSSTVTVYLGNGAGGFSGTVKTTGLGAATATEPSFQFILQDAGDLDRDGFTDLAVSESCLTECPSAHAGVLMNDRTGHFTYKRLFNSVINVDRVSIHDLNQDGFPDLLMNSQEEDPFIRPLTALLRQPNGTYLQKMIYSRPLESGFSYSFTAPAFGDWDGDGIKDLAFGESFFSEGADQGQRWLRLLYPADNSLSSLKSNVGIPIDAVGDVVSADFDRDGRPDLAYVAANSLEVYLNRAASAPVCSAATALLRTVTLCSPKDASTVGSPTRILATASSGSAISTVKIYIDGLSRYITEDNLVNTFFTLPQGTHKVTVKAWDVKGAFSASHTFAVGAGCTASTTNRTVKICAPANGSVVTSPVRLTAQITDSAPVSVKVYVDGVSQLSTTSKSIDFPITLSVGSHKITVRAWDASGNFSSSTVFTVN